MVFRLLSPSGQGRERLWQAGGQIIRLGVDMRRRRSAYAEGVTSSIGIWSRYSQSFIPCVPTRTFPQIITPARRLSCLRGIEVDALIRDASVLSPRILSIAFLHQT